MLAESEVAGVNEQLVMVDVLLDESHVVPLFPTCNNVADVLRKVCPIVGVIGCDGEPAAASSAFVFRSSRALLRPKYPIPRITAHETKIGRASGRERGCQYV